MDEDEEERNYEQRDDKKNVNTSNFIEGMPRKERSISIESAKSTASAASSALVNFIQAASDKISSSSKDLVSRFIDEPQTQPEDHEYEDEAEEENQSIEIQDEKEETITNVERSNVYDELATNEKSNLNDEIAEKSHNNSSSGDSIDVIKENEEQDDSQPNAENQHDLPIETEETIVQDS
jgi:hypothetical protein